jgi:hypothetical protein
MREISMLNSCREINQMDFKFALYGFMDQHNRIEKNFSCLKCLIFVQRNHSHL